MGAPLGVWGPAAAVDAWRDWVRPGADVTLTVVGPGDRVRLETTHGPYDVAVLDSAHAHPNRDSVAADAVLYDVTGPDDARLLLATDTGPLPAPTLRAVAGAQFDLVLLDETFGDVTDHGTGHLDLATFPRAVAALRAAGAVGARTDVVAVHLGHGNPDPAALERRLAAWGARTLPDLAVVQVGPRRDAAPATRPGSAGTRRTLLLGGARSGKSAAAEAILAADDDVLYVATADPTGPDPDPEWGARVAAHRGRRPRSWSTTETLDVAAVLKQVGPGRPVLVDCLSLWLAGQLDRAGAWDRGWDGPGPGHGPVQEEVDALVDAVRWTVARVVLVSTEVGLGVVPVTASGRLFRDLLGGLNARVAAVCDDVVLLVAGLPLRLSGTPVLGPAGATRTLP